MKGDDILWALARAARGEGVLYLCASPGSVVDAWEGCIELWRLGVLRSDLLFNEMKHEVRFPGGGTVSIRDASRGDTLALATGGLQLRTVIREKTGDLP